MSCEALIAAIDAYLVKADKKLGDQLKAEGYAETGKTLEAVNSLEENIAAALTSQTEAFVTFAAGSETLEQVFQSVRHFEAEDVTGDTISAAVEETYNALLPQLTESYIGGTDSTLTFKRMSERAKDFVSSWSKQLGELMRLDSHREIEKIITDGIDKGDSISDLADKLLTSGIRNEAYKARRAALTEGLRAHSYAQLEGLKQTPACVGKIWVHTGAYATKPRANHVAMDGTEVGIDEKFELKGENGTYLCDCPRDTALPPEESINCHCLLKKKIDRNIMSLSPEQKAKMQEAALAADDADWEKEFDARNRAKAGIDISSENAILNDITVDSKYYSGKLQHYEITDDSISKVPQIEIQGFTNAESKKLWQAEKDLLEYVRNEKVGTEAVFTLDMKMNEIERHISRKGSGIVGVDYHDEDCIVIHNHPDGLVFSDKDYVSFSQTDSMKCLVAVGNNGNVFVIKKMAEFIQCEFDFYTFDIRSQYPKNMTPQEHLSYSTELFEEMNKYNVEAYAATVE